MTTSSTATLAGAALALTALSAAAAPAAAQQSGSEWLAWTGCWVEAAAPASAPMTCVVPGDDGVTLLTVTSDGVTDRNLLRGDGVERAVAADGCVGVQAAELSRDGERVFTRSRLSCDGGSERSTRGLMAMVSPYEWIQVRALTVGQGSVSWVTRYRAASDSRVEAAGLDEVAALTRDRRMAVETARMAAAAAPTVEDIIEAHERTEPEAVRAWVVEHGAPMELDAERLLRLADAGVSEEVIDVMVAVSYPERFQVAREPQRSELDDRDRRGYGLYDRYDRYGYWRYGNPYFYDPFYYDRYSRYGYGGYYGSRSPTVIVINPVGDGEARGTGRAVNGRGYTRGGSDATSRTLRPSPTARDIRPARSSGSGTPAASSSSRGSSSSSSSKGKAKPRGGGGG